jgi:hypothetical protein
MPESEPDKKRKKAYVYLAKSALSSSGKDDGEGESEGVIPHWAVCVHFYEYRFWVEIGGKSFKVIIIAFINIL